MSEDASTTSKDPSKISKKKNSGTNSDFKQQPRKGSKDYQVYFEAKGSEKPSKDQSNTGKGAAGSTNLDEHQGQKNSNKQKSHAKNRKESRDQGWKKKYPRVSKELIIEFYLKAPLYTDIDELVSTCSQLFVKDKQIPVNNEDNQLDPSEGLILKANYPPPAHNATHGSSNPTAHTSTHAPVNQSTEVPPTTTANVNTNNVTNTTTNAPTTGFVRSAMPTAPSSTKTTELSEAPVNLNDPIQAMRERMKRDKAKKEAAQKAENAQAESKSKEENAGDVKKESQEEAHLSIDEKENKNINSQEIPNQSSNQTQKESAKEDNTKLALEGSQTEKQRKEEIVSQTAQTEARSPTKYQQVDFSNLSSDAGRKERSSDDLSSQQVDASGSNRQAQQRSYQENANLLASDNPNYTNQDLNQNNMYRGASNQQIQQINTQFANKGNMQEQSSPTKRESPGSFTNIPKVLPPSIVFKYFSPNYDDKVWSYVDLEGKLQGPFSGRTMDEWYSKGYLPLELNVTIGKGNGFKGLKDLVEIIVNHNTQGESQSPMAKTQTPPKMQAQDYQYQQQYPQQYQQQQQQRQYQQQQQQYPQQQAQYNQQKSYYQQQQQDPRSYQEYAQYGSTTPTASGNRNKAMEGFDSSNAYYGHQGQYSGSQGNVIYGKVTEIDPQSQTYYSNTQYYSQESTPKSGTNYGNYKQSPNINANQNAYYQDQTPYSGYNQPAYNQPQKQQQQQVKANYPTPMQQNYSGGNQMGSYGGNYGGQTAGMGGQANSRDYSNYGGNTGNMTSAQMYAMQQQMMNKGAGMGGGNANMNANMSGDMTMHLKNMLGVVRPSSRQEGHEYQ